uniref:Uncharacterized protein n=1 Tax=Rhizophagus irregularis (strain DAOM 181602 / DAOM 197198 / MUCL 43194) TaxID=747089 RepID=U9TKH0_RHIID
MSIMLLCLIKGNTLLFAINEIEDYWIDKPPKKHIYILVKLPVLIITSSHEQELLDELSALCALLNKFVHAFDVVVSPKQMKSFK